MAFIQLRNFKSANLVGEKCAKLFEEDTIRWYNAQEYNFILSMHLSRYKKAASIREIVVSSRSFKNQLQNRIQTWKLYDAFLYYLTISKKLPKSHKTIPTFRINKFLNEVQVFSLDKKGRNVPILIIQILIEIHQKGYDQLTTKIERCL